MTIGWIDIYCLVCGRYIGKVHNAHEPVAVCTTCETKYDGKAKVTEIVSALSGVVKKSNLKATAHGIFRRGVRR